MYDLEEQEKIDALKGWWHENRTSVVVVAVVALASYAGVEAWKSWKAREAEQAAGQYATFQAAAGSADVAKTAQAAAAIESAAASSPFAARAALAAAQALGNAGKADEAQAQYRWVIEHAKETELQALARVRLAGSLADAGKYDDALHALDSGIDTAFATLAGDRRGDILLAQGKPADARTAYQQAIQAAEASDPLKATLQAKLDALGTGQ